MSLRIRRGTEIQRNATLFDLGEPVYTTDTKQLFIGDGVTPGGKNVVENCDGIGLQWNPLSQKLDIDGTGLTTENILESGDNLYFKTDRAQDAAAALFTPNTGHTGISFLYDDTSGKIYATVTSTGGGLTALIDDETPRLGGTLDLNGNDINGIGNINITGDITATSISANLGGNLGLNSNDINGIGNINITGDITATSISANLGGNLGLNSNDINGIGNIDIIGDITATTISAALGGNLGLNSYNIDGTGNINITGDITATSITADLGGDLGLNSHDITGTGNINISGDISSYNLSLAGEITSIVFGDISQDNIVGLGSDINPATILIKSHYKIIDSFAALNPTDGNVPSINVNISRGTTVTPTAVEDGDMLSDFIFSGFDGTAYDTVSAISVSVDGAVSSGVIPGKLTFAVGNYFSSPTTMQLYSFDFYGGFTMPILTAAPALPKVATTYVADGILWDPAVLAASLPYPVFYDGSTYNKLY